MRTIFLSLVLSLPLQATAGYDEPPLPECRSMEPPGFGKRRLDPSKPADWKYLMCNAEGGHKFYQYYVGLSLIGANRRPPEGYMEAPENGLSWITKAAAQGNHNAQRTLAHIYFEGRCVEKDVRRAYQWRHLMMQSKEYAYREESLAEIKMAVPQNERKTLEDTADELLEPAK